jgi:hypothetical protein
MDGGSAGVAGAFTCLTGKKGVTPFLVQAFYPVIQSADG